MGMVCRLKTDLAPNVSRPCPKSPQTMYYMPPPHLGMSGRTKNNQNVLRAVLWHAWERKNQPKRSF